MSTSVIRVDSAAASPVLRSTTGAGEEFRRARDFLRAHRDDYATAYAGVRWPDLPQFNWALEHFDVIARDNAATALWMAVAGDWRE